MCTYSQLASFSGIFTKYFNRAYSVLFTVIQLQHCNIIIHMYDYK